MTKRRNLDIKKDFNELEKSFNIIKNSKYRQYYHVNPITGLLNDPNGFSYHNGKWILFYQWYPFAPFHGQKHWYRTESNDLVDFENKGVGIIPNKDFENNGAYSGTALSKDDKLHIFYTANYRDENSIRKPKQIHAVLENGLDNKNIIIETNYIYTEHQRDPSIYYNAKDKNYYIFIGAQTKEKKGCIILYKSSDLEKWNFQGQLKIEGYEDFGYMWECPSFTNIDGKDVLLFSPQGIKSKNYKFENKDNNGYIIGEMNFNNNEFIPHSEFIQIDRGFEFYASQIAKKKEDNYLISWLGLPDVNTSMDNEFANSSLSLVRKLKIKDNMIYQKIVNLDNYFNSRYHLIGDSLEIEEMKPMKISLSDIKQNLTIQIYGKKDQENSGVNFIYDNDLIILDRRYMDNIFNKESSNIRCIKETLYNLEIYIDKSSIEILINDGKYSMTSRVLPSETENMLKIKSSGKININYTEIKKIDEKFIL